MYFFKIWMHFQTEAVTKTTTTAPIMNTMMITVQVPTTTRHMLTMTTMMMATRRQLHHQLYAIQSAVRLQQTAVNFLTPAILHLPADPRRPVNSLIPAKRLKPTRPPPARILPGTLRRPAALLSISTTRRQPVPPTTAAVMAINTGSRRKQCQRRWRRNRRQRQKQVWFYSNLHSLVGITVHRSAYVVPRRSFLKRQNVK